MSTTPAPADVALAAAFAARLPDALEGAYRAFGPLLRAVARGVLHDDNDAQDCVHEALLGVWTKGAYRTERGGLRPFLVVCVRNAALMRIRATTRRERTEARAYRERDIDAEDDIRIDDHVRTRRIRAALAALPAEQRRVIELAYYGERTQTEIAAAIGVPLGTVKSRAARALRTLAATLAEERP